MAHGAIQPGEAAINVMARGVYECNQIGFALPKVLFSEGERLVGLRPASERIEGQRQPALTESVVRFQLHLGQRGGRQAAHH